MSIRDDLTINGLVPGNGTCAVDGCRRGIDLDRLMCHGHWARVPQELATKVFRHVQLWRRGRSTLVDLRGVQREAVHSVEAQLEETE